MKRTLPIVIMTLTLAAGLNLWAQQKARATDNKGERSAQKVLLPTVYLGKSEFAGGNIRPDEFNRLMKQGLTAKDSMGNRYKVTGFDFNYVERELYEDSAGNLKVMADIFYEYCPGDTVTPAIAASIYDRVKPGDTVFIERVRVVKYLNKSMKAVDTLAIAAKNMKCVFVK